MAGGLALPLLFCRTVDRSRPQPEAQPPGRAMAVEWLGRGPRGPGGSCTHAGKLGGQSIIPRSSWCGRRSHPTQLIYDAFNSKRTHFRTPLLDINYLKGLICITVVGQCLTRKHSRFQQFQSRESYGFFLLLSSTSERGG